MNNPTYSCEIFSSQVHPSRYNFLYCMSNAAFRDTSDDNDRICALLVYIMSARSRTAALCRHWHYHYCIRLQSKLAFIISIRRLLGLPESWQEEAMQTQPYINPPAYISSPLDPLPPPHRTYNWIMSNRADWNSSSSQCVPLAWSIIDSSLSSIRYDKQDESYGSDSEDESVPEVCHHFI